MNYPDRYPTWAAEYAGTHRQPRVATTLLLFAVVTVLLLNALGGYRAYADHVDQGNAGKPSTLCAEHAGRPGWGSVCPSNRSIPVNAKRHRPTDLDGLGD